MNNPSHIGRRTFLKGAGVSLALPFMDSLSWAAGTKVDLSGLDNLAAYKARMDADAGVQAALKAEGLA